MISAFAAKHFIVDDICCYIGSQNLYICDLAEWGVVIDDAEQVEKIKEQYWDQMWKTSFLKDDCDVQAVMDGLDIDRSAPQSKTDMTIEQIKKMKEKMRAVENAPEAIEMRFGRKKVEGEASDSDEGSVSSGED